MKYSNDKEKIIESMIQYLDQLPGGTAITIGQLFQKLFPDDEELFREIWMSYEPLGDLEKAAKKRGFYLDMSKHDGLVEGLPSNLDFFVYKKKSGKKCPYCGHHETAKIMYGYPMFDEALEQDLAHHRIKLGGCCISPMNPTYFCFPCDKGFGTPALFLSENGLEHYEDAVTKIKFEVGGFFQGWKTVTVKKEQDQYMLMISSNLEDKCGELSEKEWNWLTKRLYNALFIHEWEEEYDDPYTMDGEQWTLTIKLTEDCERQISGSNEYPPYWNELVRTFKKLEKNLEII